MFEKELMCQLVSHAVETDKELTCKELDQVDWNILYEQLVANRMLLYGYSLIENYVPDKYNSLFSETVTKYKKIINIQAETIKRFSIEATKRNVDCFFIKGLVLSTISYGSIYLRCKFRFN